MDLDSLMARFRGPLIGLLASWGNSARDARELAQDVFAEAYLSRARFDGDWEEDGAAGAWLRGIASRLHLAHGRRGPRRLDATRRRELARDEEGPTASAELESREEQSAIRSAMNSLRESWRTVLHLHYVEGNSLAQIAGLLGVSQRSVEGRLHRARKELKQLLEANESLAASTGGGADGNPTEGTR